MQSVRFRNPLSLLLLAVLLAVAGCGEKPLTGTWVLDKPAMRDAVKSSVERRMAANTGQDSPQTLELMRSMLDGMVDGIVQGMSGTLTLHEDGSFTAQGTFGACNLTGGVWTSAGDQITLDAADGQDDMSGAVKGDLMELTPQHARVGLAADFLVVFRRAPARE